MTATMNHLRAGADCDALEASTRAALAEQGFGVMTLIDVNATPNKTRDVEMLSYRIRGAGNSKMAHPAIAIEPRVEAMLPFHMTREGGRAASAIVRQTLEQAHNNPARQAGTGHMRDLLAPAVEAV